MRSSFGGHIAGTGIAGPTAEQFDNFNRKMSIKVARPGFLPTDYFGHGKEGKQAFENYCKENSSEVVVYKRK